MREKRKTLTLKDVPQDIRNFLLDEQVELRKSPSGSSKQISIEATIYKLLHSHPKFKK